MQSTRIEVPTAALVAFSVAIFVGIGPGTGSRAAASDAVPAPADSLLSPRDAPPDSSAFAPLDSALVDTLRVATPADSTLGESPRAVLRPVPLVPSPVLVTPQDLREVRPETLEDVVEWIPGASVRVAGDQGMAAHVGLQPLGGTAPEIWMDGMPTRSPADLDPGLWDRSAIAVDRAGDFAHGPFGAPGDPGWWLQSHELEEGRVVARSRFSSTAHETFQRAISATTPASGRTLRFDFEEWKTEEGYLYSGAPGVISRSDAGRSKMRRFRIGGDVDTGAGRVRMFFGRGRRYHRGDVLSALARERWTGELALALDHHGSSTAIQARAWHLDFSDDDRILDQQIDASRTGLHLERRPLRAGWLASASVERWSARYVPDDTLVVGPRPALVVRARLGSTFDPAGRFVPWAYVDGAWADHLADEAAVGGRVGADLLLGSTRVRAVAERALRVPTLAETSGRFGFETITPLEDSFEYTGRTWSWQGSDQLAIERQDRIGLQWEMGGEHGQLVLGVDHRRLREGVGWQPGETTTVTEALVTPDVRAEVNHATASGRYSFGLGAWSVRGVAHGQRVLGSLVREDGRGAGWPQWNLRARLVADRRFYSVHNRLGVQIETAGLGPRYDDAVGAFSDLLLPTRWVIDGRLRLSIRDAVMSVGYDNLLDTELDEVLGTFRRGRQLRWQLDWTFYN